MAAGVAKKQVLQLSEKDVEYLAWLYGLRIEKDDVLEVVGRLNALLEEVEKFDDLDLSRVEPIPVFLPSEEY
jgi:Asp-tRNA(Asn)/Glu-tRNA(Gln) amidotransferase C subunit